MNTVQRYDYAEIKAVKTDEGFLRDTPIVARVGIQEYRQPDMSIRRELRLPEEVFHADALASMKGKPITITHPKSGRVTAKDAHRVTVGTMLTEGKQDGENVRTEIVIHSPDSMGNARQLSLGYKADMDETPGVHPVYGQYDAIQRNIRVNHLSVVPVARAGAIARLNLDSMDQEDFSTQQEQQTMSMVKVKLDSGLEYECAPEVSVALDKLRSDAAEAAKQLAAIPTLTAERDTLKARVDGFKVELDKATDAGKAAGRAEAEAKTKLDAVATAFKIDAKDKTERQIKEAVIKAVTPALNLDGKDDAYIDVAFAMAQEFKGDAAMASQRQQAQHRADGGEGNKGSMSARDKMIARMNGQKEDK